MPGCHISITPPLVTEITQILLLLRLYWSGNKCTRLMENWLIVVLLIMVNRFVPEILDLCRYVCNRIDFDSANVLLPTPGLSSIPWHEVRWYYNDRSLFILVVETRVKALSVGIHLIYLYTKGSKLKVALSWVFCSYSIKSPFLLLHLV